jgi:hypothetical protein
MLSVAPVSRFRLLASLLLAAGPASAATPISGITDFGTAYEELTTGSATGAGLTVEDVFGWDFTLVTRTAEDVGIFVEDLAWSSGSGLDYYPITASVTSLDFLSGSSNNGAYFDFKGLNVSVSAMTPLVPSVTVVVKGYRNGLEVATHSQFLTLNSGSSSQFDYLDVSAIPAFNGIDEFRIMPDTGSEIGYLGIDNLNAVNFIPEPSSVLLAGILGTLCVVRRRR